MPTNIPGESRKQRVFAVKETTVGTLTFPAASDFIRPAGDATVNQSPSFTNSQEKADTLDVFNQFQDAMPPADWTVPMYARPSGTLGADPQGDVLFESLIGVKQGAVSCELDAEIVAVDSASCTIDEATLTGAEALPERGVIEIDTEQIHYASKSSTGGVTTLSGLTRGYNGTTAATHADAATVTLKSLVYRPGTSPCSFSLWIETDHFIQFCSGCATNQMAPSISNQGAIMLNAQGQGMRMGWAGTSSMGSAATSGATAITLATGEGKLFTAGARIQNETKDKTNSGSGYTVTAVSGDVLTISPAIDADWDSDDVVKGYLPEATVIGSTMEGSDTDVEINGVATTFKSGDLTISCPKNFPTDEVGSEYPTFYMSQERAISFPLNIYFRSADAKYFQDGLDGAEVPVEFVFGDSVGGRMAIYMKRCKLQVPTVNFAAPAVELNMTATALGTDGEDSIEIRFE